jgi:hypothetical protein
MGVPLEKSVTSQRERKALDVVTRRYGNGNMAAQTTWPPELASHISLWQRQYGGINNKMTAKGSKTSYIYHINAIANTGAIERSASYI